MHLVVLAEDFYPTISGGAHVRWHFSRLAAESNRITVFTPRVQGTEARETVDGVEIVRPFEAKPHKLPSYAGIAVVSRILYSVLITFYLIFWLRGKSVDGIHSTDHSIHWTATVVSELYSIPHVSFVGYTPTIHTTSLSNPKVLLERLNFRLFMGDFAFCRTPEVRESLVATGTDSKILHGILDKETIRSTVDSLDRDAVRDEYRVDADDRLLVFVGRITPLKRVRLAVDVVSRLPDGFKLLIVGDGPEQSDIRRYVSESNLDSDVEFTGRLPHEEALEIIAAADGLILTSKAESYSAVALEALALGRSVFATPVGVLPEVEHERLYLGEPTTLPEIIESCEFDNERCVDEETLSRFSMGHYTETILNKFDEL
jgi:glycosyltransferase involved in cell wall biosynthesis